MKNNAVCYLTNNKNTEEMERRYKLLPHDTDNFIITEIKNNLTYNNEIKLFKFDSNIDYITSPFIRWTYVSLINFYDTFPDYDYYWLLEDDLLFNGDFSVFFNDTKKLDEDIIICYGHYRDKSNNEGWYNVEGNKIFNYEVDSPLAGGFACIQRWSNKFTSLLSNLHKNKAFGHLESFPMTVAFKNNMKIGFFENIFKEQNYYMQNYCNYHTCFNLNDMNNLPKNTLIHAVKF